MIIQESTLRKDRPAGRWGSRPRLGWLSGLALLALVIAQVVGIPANDPLLQNPHSHIWLATIWAGWAVSVWITIQPPLALRRLAAAAALLAWHCGIMEMARQQPLARYVLMFAGFSIFQVTAAVLLRLPRWELPSPRRSGKRDLATYSAPSLPPRPGQFGILSLLVLMTVVAAVLWAARRYGDTAGESFLHGAVIALLMLAAVTATAIAAATVDRWGVALLVLMFLLAAASSAVMARQEIVAAEGGDFAEFWTIYFTIEVSFAMLLYGIGICGRIDAAADPPA